MNDITCPHCGFTEDHCFFPDIFCEDARLLGGKIEYAAQAKLLEEIQRKGFNVVHCGECGYVLIHEIGQ